MTTPFTTGTFIESADYNLLQAQAYDILGYTANGYGLVKINSVPVSNVNLATYNQWNDIVQDLRRIDKHINNLARPTTNFTTGTIIRANTLTGFFDVLESLEPERYNVSPSQIYIEATTTQAINFLGVETTTPHRGGISVTSDPYWIDEQQQISYVSWGSNLLARHFFNAGGELVWTLSLDSTTGQSDSDQAWTTLVQNIQDINVETGFPAGQPFTYDRNDFLNPSAIKTFSYTTDTVIVTVVAEKIPIDSPNRIKITVDLMNFGGVDLTPTGYNIAIIPGYSLTSTAVTVLEGNSVTINLATTNVPNGTLVPYEITGSGITAGDFSGLSSLSGNLTVSANAASIVLTPNIDFSLEPEGNETFTFSLSGTDPLQSVNILVLDVESTFVINASAATIYEGDTVTLNFSTTNVPDSTVLNYEITGMTASGLGLGALSGTVTINGNAGSVAITPPIEYLSTTITPTETFTFTLNPSTSKSTNTTVTVLGTVRTYTLNISPDPVNEGASTTVTLTTNLSNGQQVPFIITGTNVTSADLGLGSLTGNFTISSGAGALVMNISNDSTTEGIETAFVSLLDFPSIFDSVTINDTSTDPGTDGTTGGPEETTGGTETTGAPATDGAESGIETGTTGAPATDGAESGVETGTTGAAATDGAESGVETGTTGAAATDGAESGVEEASEEGASEEGASEEGASEEGASEEG